MPDRSSRGPHILVAGPSKTGTTGLYTSVKRGLRDAGVNARTLFEPSRASHLDSLFIYAPDVSVMTKVTFDTLPRVIPDPKVFDRRVMTVRDPRDVLVSALLFRPLTVGAMRRADEVSVKRFIRALEEKESDPSAHSVRGLFDLAEQLGIGSTPYDGMAKIFRLQQAFLMDGNPNVLHYERFIRGDLDELSDYLGFPVVNTSARDATWIGHIARSSSSGDFKRWFLEEDLAYFNKRFGAYLTAFGYEVDASLDPDPRIDPATSSEYVRSRYEDRKAKLQYLRAQGPEWTPQQVTSIEALERLVERADDGNPLACLRVAEVYVNGHLDEPDLNAALDWARRGAQLGHGPAMRLTADLIERLHPADPALRRERRGWLLELTARSRREERRQAAQVAVLETEVQRIRSSTRYRVGSLVAQAARDPLRRAPRLGRELARLARHRRA